MDEKTLEMITKLNELKKEIGNNKYSIKQNEMDIERMGRENLEMIVSNQAKVEELKEIAYKLIEELTKE